MNQSTASAAETAVRAAFPTRLVLSGGIYAGIWEATPGKWRIVYDEWEYFHILSGLSIVTEDGGAETHLKAGNSMILRPGFKGTWEVIETTRKDYVIRV